jgi:hypothetical protein
MRAGYQPSLPARLLISATGTPTAVILYELTSKAPCLSCLEYGYIIANSRLATNISATTPISVEAFQPS